MACPGPEARGDDFMIASLDGFVPFPDQLATPPAAALSTAVDDIGLPLPPGAAVAAVPAVWTLDQVLQELGRRGRCATRVRRAAEALRAAGARKVVRVGWPPLLLHVQSSMRIGASEADSVLDANAEARWSAGDADRGEELRDVLRRRPLGASESPVVSTDPRLTDGLRVRA